LGFASDDIERLAGTGAIVVGPGVVGAGVN
jgi:hypothetical protein